MIAISGKKRSGKDTVAGFVKEALMVNGIANEGDIFMKPFAAPLKRLLSMLTGVPVENMETNEQKESTFPKLHKNITESGIYRALIDGAYDMDDEQLGDKLIDLVNCFESFITQAVIKSIEHFFSLVENSTEPVSVRRMLQWLGTEAFRTTIPQFWIKMLKTNSQSKFLKIISQLKQTILTDIPRSATIIVPDLRFLDEMQFLRTKKALTIRVHRKDLPVDPNPHVSETELDNEPHDIYIENDSTLEELREKVFLLVKNDPRFANKLS